MLSIRIPHVGWVRGLAEGRIELPRASGAWKGTPANPMAVPTMPAILYQLMRLTGGEKAAAGLSIAFFC
jgi:hypothetical protein